MISLAQFRHDREIFSTPAEHPTNKSVNDIDAIKFNWLYQYADIVNSELVLGMISASSEESALIKLL